MLAVTLLPVDTLLAQDAPAAAEAAPAAEEKSFADLGGDSGDTAWMIVATALVLFMTFPGLALFYGGLVRAKNILSILVQCFAVGCLMTILWLVYGYTLAYGEGNAFIGNLDKMFLQGVGVDTIDGSIPESVFFTFQMTFAIITPALIVGAFAERMKFSSVLVFCTIWFTFSYVPVWHMVWGGGLIAGWSAMDFVGGTVVHINAGVAGLVTCILLGKRKGYGSAAMSPHSVPMTIIGASMLWVGWFGFNAGSQLAADGGAGMALLVTQVATATAAFTWMVVEWIVAKKPTAVGIATGAVAGLVAITPASGSAGPLGALIIGFASAVVCYFCATSLKKALGYDDSLDVFGVHGIGGIVGAILTGVCAAGSLGGAGLELPSISLQVWAQIKSVVVTIIWSGVVSFIAFYIASALTGGCRVSEDEEQQGLDLNSHGESGYN
ncbi:MAG: ammonia channel protein [Verrucomicrobiales bacterium]|nr:ammonia channel protein [Verrucomicrobiales bacterium]